MEVRSANIALTNRAAAAIDNSGSNGKEQHPAMKVNSAVPEESQDLDEQSVMISISAAGLRRSLLLEKQAEKDESRDDDEEVFSGEAEALPVLTGCALGLGGCALGLWWYGRKDIAA